MTATPTGVMALGEGRIVWWMEAPWIGYALCAAVVLMNVLIWTI